MKLSNKKIKYIRRYASKKSPEAIAKDLGINVRDVRLVLGQSAGKAPRRKVFALDMTLSMGLLLVTFLAPFMVLRGIWDFANLPQLAFIQVGVVFLLLIWLIRGFAGKGCLIAKSPLNLPILVFVFWSLISISYAHNKYEALLPWMSWTASALMFFLVLNGSGENRTVMRLLATLFVAGCLCALLGIGQHLFGVSWVPQVKAPASTFANKNMATHFVVMTLPLAVGLAFNSRQNKWTWVVALACALMISFLIYTKTRAGWVALSAEVVLLAVLLLRERLQNKSFALWNRRNILSAGSALVLVFVMMNLGPQGFKWGLGEIVQETATMTQFQDEGDEGELGGDKNIELRKAIWLNTVEMIKDRPWTGWGLGNHKVFYPLYHRKAVQEKFFSETAQLSHVHNDFLQAFAELGLPGVILLLWLAVVLAFMVFRLTSTRYPDHIRFWTMSIAVGVVGLLVNAFFSFPFQRSIPPFVFMIFIGALGAFYAGEDRAWYVLKERWFILGASCVVLIAWVWLIRFHVLSLWCDRHFMFMSRLEKSRQWEAVIAEGKKAHQYNPSRTKVLSYLGRAYVETGKYREGVEALEQVIAAYPNHMNALLNIGVAYGSLGENENALAVYERVLRIKPDYGKVHNNMGNIYMKQKKLSQAIKEFELAAELDPKNSIIHFNVGTAKMHIRQYEEAAEAFEEAVEYKQDWALAHKRLGGLYLQYLNRKEDGIAHLNRALELNPGMKDADKLRQLIQWAQKEDP